MLDATQRRAEILRIIQAQSQPVSASLLARQLNVSRQIIVGDVALLRAQGHDIISTARGYLRTGALRAGRYQAKLACLHREDQTRDELYTIVDHGGHVLNVIVEHPLYGELSGELELTCRSDVDQFMAHIASGETRLLSALTGGVHLHTVSCADEQVFHQIQAALAQKGLLYTENTAATE